jgi:hypothetical protein
LEGGPGYLEIDLVSHSGPWASGDWIYTLSGTDLETGWSELVPVMTKSQREVLAGLVRLRGQLPFPLLGMHIDNGHEFLNAAMVDYCREHEIELSRGRPFHSDDNPHVEQKNGYLVRRLLGNFRLDSAEQLAWLDRLYSDLLRPFNNCFQPVMHSLGRIQVGGRTRRLHDTPRTPLQRLVEDRRRRGRQDRGAGQALHHGQPPDPEALDRPPPTCDAARPLLDSSSALDGDRQCLIPRSDS